VEFEVMFQNAKKWGIIYTMFASAFEKQKINPAGGFVCYSEKIWDL